MGSPPSSTSTSWSADSESAMMATSSMGPNFNAGHPAGMGHPGVAGHPMGPGMPHQPGQQGAPGGMPHQFAGGPMGVPPGAQVNAMMAAMPPGMAAQFQNMPPAQQQAFMQQHQQQQQQQQHSMQQQFAQNPNLAALRQQQMMAQHHQQQQAGNMMAQQFDGGVQHPGMPIGQMQLTPQQIHALRQQRAAMPMQHPNMMYAMHQQQQQQAAHQQQLQAQAQQQAQQQQAQQQHQQQQQQQQQQHGPQQQQPGQPGPVGQMNVPNMPGMPPQGQPNQAQMNVQQPNHQPGPQAQPTRTQTPSQQQNQPQQGVPQPHHTPQQASQAGTPADTGGQTPGQTPGSTAAQQQGPQPPPQPQVQQPQGPPQHPQPQPQPQSGQQAVPQQMQQHPQMSAAHQHVMQSQLMTRRQMQQQQHNVDGIRGQCLLKLMQFGEHLSGYAQNARGRDDHSYWATFVDRFFAPEGVFRHSLHITDGGETTDKQYDIASSAIARYFHTHFHSGVKNIQLILDKGTMDRALPNDCHLVENHRASLVYWFETGSHLVANGTLRASFNSQQKLDLFEFVTSSQEEYVSRKQVIEAAKPTHAWIKEWRNVNSDMKQSPELSRKGKGKQLKSPQTHPPEVLMDLPDSAVDSKGVTPAVHQFLEMVEVMGQMNPLFSYYHANPGMGPYAALEQYVATNIMGQGVPNGQPGQPNARTPSFNQFQMGASPAIANANLPGSPHMGSPAPGQMQAPQMQMQQSQQGTSSSGPSANTSPASNKRRRPSGVKLEDDGSGAPTPQMNGVQNRPGKPATPRMNKRTKVNPS